MINSMTGYGRGEGTANGYRVLVEIKAVNHRYAEVVVRMPRDYLLFEDAIKKTVLQRVARGRLDVYVTVEKLEQAQRTVLIDEELALSLKNAADALSERMGLEEPLTLTELLKQEGVLQVVDTPEDPAQLEELLLTAVGAAADSLTAMRQVEGQRLAQDFATKLGKLRQLVAEIGERSPAVVVEYRDRLEKRLREALDGKVIVDEARLLTEVALLADRASIEEEVVRLHSHFAQFESILQAEEPIGRKLDFLVQEMNREVNTIGSKANDLHIAQHVVEAKSVLEQIREQIQNVE
ncbi:MAG TPA: YicC/YloC family endoribonuclease [Bacilli bacterium]|nr:YicC/YloC family endoribonuclease [Bacilli bacterium]